MSGAASFTTVTIKRDLEQKHLATLAFGDTEGWLGTEFLFPWDDTVSFLAGFPRGRITVCLAAFGDGLCPLLPGTEPLEGFCVHPKGSSSSLAAGGACGAARQGLDLAQVSCRFVSACMSMPCFTRCARAAGVGGRGLRWMCKTEPCWGWVRAILVLPCPYFVSEVPVLNHFLNLPVANGSEGHKKQALVSPLYPPQLFCAAAAWRSSCAAGSYGVEAAASPVGGQRLCAASPNPNLPAARSSVVQGEARFVLPFPQGCLFCLFGPGSPEPQVRNAAGAQGTARPLRHRPAGALMWGSHVCAVV